MRNLTFKIPKKKNSFKIIFSTAIGCIFLFCSHLALAQNTKERLVATFKEIVNDLEEGSCEGSNELIYHSQKLIAPSRTTSVYFKGTLRRIGQKTNSSQLQSCFQQSDRQTPSIQMIVETDKRTNTINFKPYNDTYVVSQPLSFSLDGRYLVVGEYSTLDRDIFTSNRILDLQNGYQDLLLYPCRNSQFSYYEGFLSPSEILFSCRNLEDNTFDFEVLNLKQRSIRKVPDSYLNYARQISSYGFVSSPLVIIRKQAFPSQ